jgi:hypothetical protein
MTEVLCCDRWSLYYFEPVMRFTLNIVLVSKRLQKGPALSVETHGSGVILFVVSVTITFTGAE